MADSKEVHEDSGMVQVFDFDWIEYFERTNQHLPEKKILSAVPDSAFQVDQQILFLHFHFRR
jgi:hypothetical protein